MTDTTKHSYTVTGVDNGKPITRNTMATNAQEAEAKFTAKYPDGTVTGVVRNK